MAQTLIDVGTVANDGTGTDLRTMSGYLNGDFDELYDYTGADSSGAMQVPVGTTGERPGSPTTGWVRYNTTTNRMEFWSGSSPAWNENVRREGDTLSGLYQIASGVNLIALNGSATTVPVSLTVDASSADANVALALPTKGYGPMSRQVPDSAALGGDPRGNYAVDFGSLRNLSTEVAAGDNSFLVGRNGRAAGKYSVVLATNDDNAIAYGEGCAALGRCCETRVHVGRLVFASQQSVQSGDGQMGEMVVRLQTTTNGVANLTADGTALSGDNYLYLNNNTIQLVQVNLVARDTSNGDTAAWIIRACIRRGASAGSTEILGTVSTSKIAGDAGTSSWTATVVVNAAAALGDVTVQVSGASGRTIWWVACLRTVEG